MHLWPTLYIVLEWVVRVAMIPVVVRRRRPATATAWLLVISFLPLVGLVVYFLVGESWLPFRRLRRHARVRRERREAEARFRSRYPDVSRPLAPDLTAMVDLAQRLGDLPILHGNQADIVGETDDFADRLVADIDAATDHVHLLYYIYADDDVGRKVADALLRAAARGVTCRVLVDSAGTSPRLKRLGATLAQGGVALRYALPVRFLRRSVARIDLRNHRKIAIVDGRVAYSGSHNVVGPEGGHKRFVWRDLSVRLVGPAVMELQAVFLGDWYTETDEELDGEALFAASEGAGDVPVQVLPSGPAYPTENYHRLVVSALYGARKRVVITTPYFVPDDPLLQAMEVAVLRGVQVDLIVPKRSDHRLVDVAARGYFRNLLTAGVRVHLHSDGLLHAKTMAVDDEVAFIGTSNFDIRSFALNFEVNLLLYGADITKRLLKHQQDYLENATMLDSDEWGRRSWWHRLIEGLARLLSPLL